MRKVRFEELVLQAVESLPRELQEKLENVEIVVEDWPSRTQVKKVGLGSGMTLLGLYEGIPQTLRGQAYSMVLPDKITIFRGSIEVACTSDEAVLRQIEKTVRHEIAHHFGIDDVSLSKITPTIED